MSDTIWLALISQVVVVLLALVAAYVRLREKVDRVHTLVNGQSTAQMEKIERQTALIQSLLAGRVAKRADDPALGVGIIRPPNGKV